MSQIKKVVGDKAFELVGLHMKVSWARDIPGGSAVKNLPLMQETQEMQV